MVFKFSIIFVVFAIVFNDGIKEIYCLPTYIDLTHPFKNGATRSWPINKNFTFTVGARGLIDLGGKKKIYLENNEFYMASNFV